MLFRSLGSPLPSLPSPSKVSLFPQLSDWGIVLPLCSLGVTVIVFPGQSIPGGNRAGGPTAPALAPDLSLLCPQAALQVGGHGERLTQCREVVLTTSKAIPVQVDGEPCKLAASRIRIALRNQATMVQKAKRRSAAPLHSEYVPLPATCPGPKARLCPSLEPWFPPAGKGASSPSAPGKLGRAPQSAPQWLAEDPCHVPSSHLPPRASASSPCLSSCGSR